MEKDIRTPPPGNSRTRRILALIGFRLIAVVTGVSLLGLALAFAGIVFEHEGLYKWGLKLAAPLYIIVLPLCILLFVLFLVTTCIMLVQEIMRRMRGKRGSS